MTMKPPPPMPAENGSVTPHTAAVPTAVGGPEETPVCADTPTADTKSAPTANGTKTNRSQPTDMSSPPACRPTLPIVAEPPSDATQGDATCRNSVASCPPRRLSGSHRRQRDATCRRLVD